MIGKTLGHYQIIEKLGEGGMGVVYKARDTHLDRFVAIKVLPAAKVADPERKRRFIQEAKAASALNHPNIIHIYDIDQADGVDFIAMEYVAGKSLDHRIGHRGLRLNEALKYAVQIADALAKAHSTGIVHRDVKPTNIMVNEDGVVKVLDFGLAKLTEQVQGDEAASTATMDDEGRPITEQGAIVGTVAYMSPEQAEGRKIDARSDIFSLGSVLYEMVTGQRAFQGASKVSTLSAILHEEPKPISGTKQAVPADLEKLIDRCLRKDPDRRIQHMGDVKLALEDLKEDSDSGKLTGIPMVERKGLRLWLWAVAAAPALVLAAVLIWRLIEKAPPSDLRAVALTSYSGIESEPSLSPDGNKVAFAWDGEKEDDRDIYIRQIGSAGFPMRLTKDPSAEGWPAWSPDDRWIAFWRQQQKDYALVLVPPLGGAERKLTEAITISPACPSWTPDGKWLVVGAGGSPKQNQSVWAISIETGERRRLTNFLTKSVGADVPFGDYTPSISPDGQGLAFGRRVNSWVYELYLMRLTRDLRPDGEPARVTDQQYAQMSGVAWTADGREIVYSAGGIYVQSLWQVPVSGRRTPRRLTYALPSAIYPAIARTLPRLAYSWQVRNTNIWRLDTRTNERRMLIGSTYDSRLAQYSPDGGKIAFKSNRSGNSEIWRCDADGSNGEQLTYFDGPDCGTPQWSPDGRWLAMDGRLEGQSEIYVMPADGGTPRNVTNSPADDLVPSWSRDGRWIYFASNRSGQHEVWKMPKDGGEAFQVTRSGGIYPIQSPDGKQLYYRKQGQQGLFRMPTEGIGEVQVLPVGERTFGVTAKGVYFFAGGKTIQLLDTATGKVSTLATLDRPGGLLSVSPDGTYILWSQMDRNTQDLMLVENFR